MLIVTKTGVNNKHGVVVRGGIPSSQLRRRQVDSVSRIYGMGVIAACMAGSVPATSAFSTPHASPYSLSSRTLDYSSSNSQFPLVQRSNSVACSLWGKRNSERSSAESKDLGASSTLHQADSSAAADEDKEDEMSEEMEEYQKLGLAPRIVTVHCVKDYLDFLAEDDRLCVIKFHASWCKSCQRFGVRFKKLALRMGDKIQQPKGSRDDVVGLPVVEAGQVRFAQIEFAANARLCRTLGIKKLPSVHFYKKSAGGLLASFACGPKKFPMVLDHLNEYMASSDEELRLKAVLDAGTVLGNEIVADIQKAAEQMKEKQGQQFNEQVLADGAPAASGFNMTKLAP